MVARLLEMLHIPRENLYCVGDNQNDIPMMALSAIPFAPANCAQEVKDWGATILCHCDDGVIGDIRGPAGPDLSGQTLKSEPGGRSLCPPPGCFLPIPPPGGPEPEILIEFKNFYRET